MRSKAPILGIVGGGQLARMTAQAAYPLGCEVVILERQPGTPASKLASRTILGDWNNPTYLLKLAKQVDVVTLENEFVNAQSLVSLEKRGYALWPSSSTISIVQDKFRQKETFSKAGLPVPKFADTPTPEIIRVLGNRFGWPLLLKKRRNGYDGKGNVTLYSARDIPTAWKKLEGQVNALYVEAFCPFQRELAVMISRGSNGRAVSYPVVETIQKNHICHTVSTPAAVSSSVAKRAVEIALRAVHSISGVGSFGLELFLMKDSSIMINEIAPRVHNSGHYTIEACVCSQFENHVRAVMGWPLGSTRLRGNTAAAMVNLLATSKGSGTPHGLHRALRVSGAHIHIYGKQTSSPGRKMGHVTALDKTPQGALAIARKAAISIRFGDQK